jgi:hypothetical protein
MALESEHITATAVEATEYPDLVRQYRVTGVPKTVANDTVEVLGLQSEMPFIRRVLEGTSIQRSRDEEGTATE